MGVLVVVDGVLTLAIGGGVAGGVCIAVFIMVAQWWPNMARSLTLIGKMPIGIILMSPMQTAIYAARDVGVPCVVIIGAYMVVRYGVGLTSIASIALATTASMFAVNSLSYLFGAAYIRGLERQARVVIGRSSRVQNGEKRFWYLA